MISSKLYATDKDPHDLQRLTFKIDSLADFESFTVNPLTGKLSATNHVLVGRHNVTVGVSDGSRYSTGRVAVEVVKISNEAVQKSVQVTFEGISPEAYLTTVHGKFVAALGDVLPRGSNPGENVEMLSLRSNGSNVQAVLSVKSPKRDGYLKVGRQLKDSLPLLTEKAGVRVAGVRGEECDLQCAHQCRYHVTVTSSGESPVTAKGWSLLTPHWFEREAECVCRKGHYGAKCASVCAGEAGEAKCAESGGKCELDANEVLGYRCARHDRRNSAVSFGGSSLVEYKLSKPEVFKLSLRLRTRQREAKVAEAEESWGGSLARVTVDGGKLKLEFGCGGEDFQVSGNLVQTMEVSESEVSDGNWHDVTIEPISDKDCAYRYDLFIYN